MANRELVAVLKSVGGSATVDHEVRGVQCRSAAQVITEKTGERIAITTKALNGSNVSQLNEKEFLELMKIKGSTRISLFSKLKW